jgi:polar amino acid transport system substrate-binding protein
MGARLRTRRYRRSSKSLLLASTVLVSLAVAGCGGTSPAKLAVPTDLLTHGVLTVGSDTTYPPQEYVDPGTQKATGFDVDLITAMAKALGLQAHVVPDKFDPLLDDLVGKRFDVVISAVTVTSDRQKKVDFIPYLTVGESLLVQKGNPKNIHSTDDLCGLSVGVQDGTIEQGVLQSSSDNCAEQDKPGITVISPSDQTAVIQLLATNQVVATYQDSTVTDYYAKQDPAHFAAGGPVNFPSPEGIAVRKNDSSMLDAMQAAYDQVKASGVYHQLAVKWGLTAETLAG